jgi:tRNA pseudouridine55 synthase
MRIDLLDWSPPLLTLDIECGRGTYIRSIAHELGQALGCGAYLSSLERRRVGPFTTEDSVSLEQLSDASQNGNLHLLLYPADLLLLHLPAAIVSDADVRAIGQGQYLHSVEFAPTPHTQCRAYDLAGDMIALLAKEKAGDMWKPAKVLLGSRIAETLGPGQGEEAASDG